MTRRASEFERLLKRDIDDLLDYARRLAGRERTTVFAEALARLEQTNEDDLRIRILRFLQALLAEVPNGRLPAAAAEPAALDLSRIVASGDEHIEARRAALDTLALLFLKAKELTSLADSRVRTAFEKASNTNDLQLRDFARTSLSPDGVLARRVISRGYRFVYFSGITSEVKASRRWRPAAVAAAALDRAEVAIRKRRARNSSRDETSLR